MKKTSAKVKTKKENIWNIPNTLTLLRVVITFAAIYLIVADYSIQVIIWLFVIGMLTDFFDGQIARRCNMTTEFGRKFDMIADRFLMIGIASALIIDLMWSGVMQRTHLMQIFLIMTREFISLPVAIIAFSSGKALPKAKYIGKTTTFLQAVTFPIIILSIYSPKFSFSIYLAFLTAIIGIFSAFTYINDVVNSEQ